MYSPCKPMLASQVDDLSSIKYPVFASWKLDGVRSTIQNGVAYSRSLKPIPNKQIQQWASDYATQLEGLDGEFIVGEPNDEQVFRNTTSFVMSHDKVQNFRFYIFDMLSEHTAEERYYLLEDYIKEHNPPSCVVLHQFLIEDKEKLEIFRQRAVAAGYEGAMVKSLSGKYKHGRSSVKEGLLLKMKLFSDSEFEIVGYEPKYHNTNESHQNELGRTARSTAKDGLVALDTLGSLRLKTADGTEFGCGSGFDDADRDELWKIRDTIVGKLATVKYFDVGGYDVPRFPVFKGIRDLIDIS